MEDDTKEPKTELPDSIRAGVYATFFSVAVNPEFVVLDFGSALPEPGKVVSEKNIIVSRIITTKNGAKKLVELLDRVIKQAESKD